MLNKIAIHNLKSIKDLEIKLSGLNLFVGPNSSGKSTILQGLLLMAQNVEEAVGLNGKFVKLGSFEENCCSLNTEKEIIVRLEQDDRFYQKKLLRDLENDRLRMETTGTNATEDLWNHALEINERKIQYLSCHRIGPRNLYEKNMSIEDAIDHDGNYAISYLNTHGNDPLELKICKDLSNYTLLAQVNWWLRYITGAEIETEEIIGADAIRAAYSMDEIKRIRPVNIGAGISYLVSVLIMCLSAPKEGILVIENPEIHLHPTAQAKVCEFLYFIAHSGRQLFIETHSDHIFNGFRVGLAEESMQSNEINIMYTYLNQEHITEAMKVEIGKYGNIRNQKEGLFDQFDIDMNRMLGI